MKKPSRFLPIPFPCGIRCSCQDRVTIKLNFTPEAAPAGIPIYTELTAFKETCYFVNDTPFEVQSFQNVLIFVT